MADSLNAVMAALSDAVHQATIARLAQGVARRLSARHRRGYGGANSRIGRTSTLPRRADGIRAATWMASFRSRASMR